MGVLSNPRHERFCQYLAQGKTASEACELAGYKPNRSNAAQMAHKEHIKDRLTQINAILAKVTQITVESLIEQNQEIFRLAKASHQYSVAVSALKEIGILTGVRVERAEVGGPGEFDHLSDDELLAALRERIAALGLTPDADMRH